MTILELIDDLGPARFAKKAGITRSYATNILARKRVPSVKMLARLVACFEQTDVVRSLVQFHPEEFHDSDAMTPQIHKQSRDGELGVAL